MKVIADYREKKVLEYLNSVEVEKTNLEIGDFIVSEKCAIERKTVKDFVKSIIDKRIFNQAKELSENFERPIIIVEGNGLFDLPGIHPNALLGALASLILDYGVTIISTQDAGETARFITALAKKFDKNKKSFSLRPGKKPRTLEEQKKFVLQGFPDIGSELSERILKKFKTLKNFFNADKKQMIEIKGIGKNKAEKIWRILHENE